MSSISVIIPAYNAEKFIGEAIESVLNQTRPAKEIIVVDDASTDRTAEIARSFGERVKVLVNEVNSGPGHSRNAGVAASTGDYLAFLDADDKWLPEHLENLAGLLDMWPETGLAFCQIEFVGRKSGMWPERIDGFLEPRAAFFDMLRNIVCVPSAMMVRRRIHEHIGGFDAATYFAGRRRVQAEDLDYVIRLSRAAQLVASPRTTVQYRWHQGQSSVRRPEQVVLSFVYRLRILDALNREKTPAEEIELAVDRIQRCWEEHIEQFWVQRNGRGLWQMVRFGLRKGILRKSTWHYVPRVLLCLVEAGG